MFVANYSSTAIHQQLFIDNSRSIIIDRELESLNAVGIFFENASVNLSDVCLGKFLFVNKNVCDRLMIMIDDYD